MNAKLKRIEIQSAVSCDDDLTVENTLVRKLLPQGIDQFRKISIQRLLIAALNEKFVFVPENQRPKPIPLWLINPFRPGGQLIDPLGQHGTDGRVDGKLHRGSVAYAA